MRIFITGSADGLGRGAAQALLAEGHQVVVHVRDRSRLAAVQDLAAQTVVGDLSDLDQVRNLADQVHRIGRMDAIIHNAGVYTGNHIQTVNVLAPYLLTALLDVPDRLIYLSSGMHQGGRAQLQGPITYSDSKLFITTLANALARRWPRVITSSVDPGWVPTKMGGPNAPDDLRLGHLTQAWLATSQDPAALQSGQYWHHQKVQTPHAASRDPRFQAELLAELERITGVSLPEESQSGARKADL